MCTFVPSHFYSEAINLQLVGKSLSMWICCKNEVKCPYTHITIYSEGGNRKKERNTLVSFMVVKLPTPLKLHTVCITMHMDSVRLSSLINVYSLVDE